MKRFIIYDIPDVELSNGSDIFFNANPYITSCGGCFGCWIKTPGKCVIADRAQITTECLSKCDEVVIMTVTMICGSPNIKNSNSMYLLNGLKSKNYEKMVRNVRIVFRTGGYDRCGRYDAGGALGLSSRLGNDKQKNI